MSVNKRDEIANLLYLNVDKDKADEILTLIDELSQECYRNGRINERNFESSRQQLNGRF